MRCAGNGVHSQTKLKGVWRSALSWTLYVTVTAWCFAGSLTSFGQRRIAEGCTIALTTIGLIVVGGLGHRMEKDRLREGKRDAETSDVA